MQKRWYSFLYVRSPILKILYGLVGVVISLITIGFATAIEWPRMDAQTASWEGRSIEKGAELFANNCSSCHSQDGKGLPGVAPALNSRYFFGSEMAIPIEERRGRLIDVGWAGSMHDYVALTIASGRPSKINTQFAQIMPTWGRSFGGPLRADQVEQLTQFVLNWQEDALAQTPEEDAWQFFQDSLSKGLPYDQGEPGYDLKLQQALTAAVDAGQAVGYEIDGVAPEVPETAAGTEEVGNRAPSELWVTMGCSGCHNIAENQTEENRGPVGPHQGNLYERAGERVEGLSAEEYVYNSIVDPGAYMVEGYQDVMPKNFADKMSEDELRNLAAWMLDPNRDMSGGSADTDATEEATPEEEAPAEEAAGEEATEEAAGEAEAAVTDGAESEPITFDVVATDLQFGETINIVDPPIWTVGSGAEVTVNLQNDGAVDHSWAVVKAGETAPTPFLIDEHADILLENTGFIPPGELGTLTFTAPEPGEYMVLCTVNGHFPVMQGKLVVE